MFPPTAHLQRTSWGPRDPCHWCEVGETRAQTSSHPTTQHLPDLQSSPFTPLPLHVKKVGRYQLRQQTQVWLSRPCRVAWTLPNSESPQVIPSLALTWTCHSCRFDAVSCHSSPGCSHLKLSWTRRSVSLFCLLASCLPGMLFWWSF